MLLLPMIQSAPPSSNIESSSEAVSALVQEEEAGDPETVLSTGSPIKVKTKFSHKIIFYSGR